jgi:hypothetical protein
MRLLNTSTLLLHEFYGDMIPKYAIFSHRWEDSEVTFQDLSEKKGPGMSGWNKGSSTETDCTRSGLRKQGFEVLGELLNYAKSCTLAIPPTVFDVELRLVVSFGLLLEP